MKLQNFKIMEINNYLIYEKFKFVSFYILKTCINDEFICQIVNNILFT